MRKKGKIQYMRAMKIYHSIYSKNNESEMLDRYMVEISKHPLLDAEVEMELAKRIKEDDLDALDLLVKSNLRFVVSVAKQYSGQGLSIDDLINEGNLGLMRAAQKFDETRGFRFISYAVWWVRQSMMQAIVEQSKIIRTPLSKNNTYTKINKAFQYLEQEYQREPEVAVVAEYADVSEQVVNDYLNSILKTISTDLRMGEDGDVILSDILSDKDQILPDEQMIKDNNSLCLDMLIEQLKDREKDIIKAYYGLGGEEPATLEEIGTKYGLTRERVRQIKEKCLERLKDMAIKTNMDTGS